MTYIIKRYGLLGNQIIQLANLIYMCKKNNANFNNRRLGTNVSTAEDFTTQFVDFKKIPFYTEIIDNEKEFSSFYDGKHGFDMKREERIEIMEQYIKPYSNFPVKKVSDRTCVIHIRSGEIFVGRPNKNYIQPPFGFYKKIIEENDNNFDEFLVVTQQDRKNPTISLLENYSQKVKIQSSSLEDDISILLGAKTIVSGYGTFLPQILFFSKEIKNIFCLDYTDFFSFFGTCLDANIIKYKFLKQYIPVGSWKNSEEQIQLMKSYSSCDIEKIL